MYIVIVTYLQPLDEVDKFLIEHLCFLDRGYQEGVFLFSGPQDPRDGGIIAAKASSKGDLEGYLKDDPFYREGLASYKVYSFTPTKFAVALKDSMCSLLK